MKHINNLDAAALKKQINNEISKGNFELVNTLTKELCELQGFEAEYKMPKAFITKLKRMDKAKKMKNMKKMMVKAAIAILVVGISGGSVYAAVRHFNATKHLKYGIGTDGVEEITESEETFTNGPLPEGKNEATIVSKENGSKDSVWLSKEVRQEKNTTYCSDDRVNWTPEDYVVNVTEYQYADYAAACKDQNLVNIFSKQYEQIGNAVYTEYVFPEGMGAPSMDLKADFSLSAGKFGVQMNGNEDSSEETVSAVITSTEPVTNQREYTSINGNTYCLSDDTETGTLRTTTLISYEKYSIIITFQNLTEKEIESVLDSIALM